jgi:2-oxoglutarate ferredoxin oxidoreductase subunit beta
MNVVTPPEKLEPKDFATDQEVRWCPGCGDYAILKAMQRTLADIGVKKENTVFVSGIGCAARFPYYMATYGFHTIHGRAPAVGTGIKLANPDLDVWIVSGDGDALSIGGNHLLHVLRRNVNVQLLLFNNEIYGLTKGQYSPTSRAGTRSPSTPLGSIENPVSAARTNTTAHRSWKFSKTVSFTMTGYFRNLPTRLSPTITKSFLNTASR